MLNKYLILLLCFILAVSLSQFINADVIFLGPGNENVIINPNEQIGGFFSCSPNTCITLGGYDCGIWADSCGGLLNCGTCGSGFTCTDGICVEVITPPPPPGPGAAAGPGVSVPGLNILIDPTEINLNMAINTAVDQPIIVTNLGTSTINISVGQQDLDNMVILDVSFLLLTSGETATFNARFVAPGTPGIYLGKIFIGGEEVPVALNIKTLLLLFDSNIVVLNEDYLVPQRDNLRTRVTLIPLGDRERLDLTLNYVIKDYSNKVYLTKSETLLVEDRVQFNRNFDTGLLPLGRYIIGLELVYPGGVAPSSAHFEVIKKRPIGLGKIILYLIILILTIATIILIVLIVRRLKRKREEASAA